MGNSIYLGGGIKSAFCGGNVKEIYQGTNKLWSYGTPEYMDIDGLSYRVAKMPDGKIWMCENCEAVQGDARFYNGDEATYGRNGKNYGRLYTYTDVHALADRLTQWRIPTSTEWTELADLLGGVDVAAEKMKSTEWGGTDEIGMNIKPGGYRGNFYDDRVETEAWFYCSDGPSSSWQYIAYFDTRKNLVFKNWDFGRGFSLRMIYDA